MDKPIPEAVLDRLAHEAYQVHCDTPTRAFPNDTHWPKWRAVVQHVADALTAAKQQGQAVVWRCAKCGTHEVEVDLVCHNSACDAYANSQTVHEGWHAQPMQQEQAVAEVVQLYAPGGQPYRAVQWIGQPPDAGTPLYAAPQHMQQGGGEVVQRHVVTKYRDGSAHVADVTAPPSAPVGVGGLVEKWRGRADNITAQDDYNAARKGTYEHCADQLEDALAQQPAAVDGAATNSAVAAIQFALKGPEGMTFLRLWNEGEFDTLRREWPDAPVEVYIDADPLAAQPGGSDNDR